MSDYSCNCSNYCAKGNPHCVHCGGSGILNVSGIYEEDLGYQYSDEKWTDYPSACHACENGKLWKEILDG